MGKMVGSAPPKSPGKFYQIILEAIRWRITNVALDSGWCKDTGSSGI